MLPAVVPGVGARRCLTMVSFTIVRMLSDLEKAAEVATAARRDAVAAMSDVQSKKPKYTE